MNEPKTTDEEWERLMALLNKEVREVAKRDLLGPAEMCAALVFMATEVALNTIGEREAAMKLLLGAMQHTMEEFDEAKKQKPEKQ